MLKREDPAFDDLVAVIKSVVSSRYVEDPDPFRSSFYIMTSREEPSIAFASLNRRDRLELLAEMVPWRDFGREGITSDQQRVIIGNVLDGKPKQQWLDGVRDEAVLERHNRDSFKAREVFLESISHVLDGNGQDYAIAGKPSEKWTEPTGLAAEQVDAMSNEQQLLKKLTMTDLKEASERLLKESTNSPAVEKSKDRSIER